MLGMAEKHRGVVVAPLVGAWIEMHLIFNSVSRTDVAPLVGAWIEIPEDIAKRIKQKSLLSWERGLKWFDVVYFTHWFSVAPLVGAWIEISSETNDL